MTLNVTGDVVIADRLTAFTSLNYQYRKTLNFPTNGYGGLGANFGQWWQRQLDMDRLAANYAFEGKYYTWNRVSASKLLQSIGMLLNSISLLIK